MCSRDDVIARGAPEIITTITTSPAVPGQRAEQRTSSGGRLSLGMLYAYLVVAPVGELPVIRAVESVSMADLGAVILLIGVLLRPRMILRLPVWYLASMAGLILGPSLAMLVSDTNSDWPALWAYVTKLIASLTVVAFTVKHRCLHGAVLAYCIGVAFSTAIALWQVSLFWSGGWGLLVAWIPPNAVVAPTTVMTFMPIRAPGGTAHPAALGVLVAFPFAWSLSATFVRQHRDALLIPFFLVGVVGFLVTESRAFLFGSLGCVGLLLAFFAVKRLRPLNVAALAALIVVSIPAMMFAVGIRVGTRIAVLEELFDMGSGALIGLGPAAFQKTGEHGSNVHSTPLQILSEGGIVAFFSYVCLVGFVFVGLWRGARKWPLLVRVLGTVFAILLPAILFHPMASFRGHWIVLSLGVSAVAISRLVGRRVS